MVLLQLHGMWLPETRVRFDGKEQMDACTSGAANHNTDAHALLVSVGLIRVTGRRHCDRMLPLTGTPYNNRSAPTPRVLRVPTRTVHDAGSPAFCVS